METSHSLGDTYDPLGSGRGGTTSFPCGIYLTGMGGGASSSFVPGRSVLLSGGSQNQFCSAEKTIRKVGNPFPVIVWWRYAGWD